MKQKFYIHLKSHTDYPDVEDSVEAQTKEEAVWIFSNKYEISLEIARENTASEKELGI